MAAGTLSGSVIGVRALGQLREALDLDDVWTDFVENLDVEDAAQLELQLPSLVSTVGGMLGALGSAATTLPELRGVLEGYTSDDVDSAIRTLLEVYPGPTEPVWAALSELEEGWDVRAAALASFEYIEENAAEAMAETATKLVEISRSVRTEGDFPAPFRCALLVGVVGAGVVGSIGPHGVITVPTLASSVGGGALAWGTSGCRETLRALRARLG
jgi:hypothetical protein